MNKPTNQPWQNKLSEGMKANVPSDTQLWILETVSELLQREREKVEISFGEKALKDILWANETAFKNGYNYARKEMKQWAEEKVGENHDKLIIELLEELK